MITIFVRVQEAVALQGAKCMDASRIAAKQIGFVFGWG